MGIFTKHSNAETVLISLLKHYNIPVDEETITNELNTHPDYPSLLAINDVALNFGLDCGAYKISKEDLHNIPCLFIANTTRNGNEFTAIASDGICTDMN